MKISGFIFALLMLIGSQSLFAGGFQINEQSARAMAMGGAYTAIAFDPSGIYFNNAAITRVGGFQSMIGTTLIAPVVSFRGPYGPTVSDPTIAESDMHKQSFFPSHAYFTYQLNNDWYVGLGFNTPFGLGTEWDNNWVGKDVSIKIDLKTFSFNPVVAYKINDVFAIGAGLQYNLGTVKIIRGAGIALSPTSPAFGDAIVNLDGSTNSALGFTVGGLAQVTKDFSLGASFRSQVNYKFKGSASSQGPTQFASVLPHGDISANLKTPAELVIGAGYQVTDKILVSADFQYVWWSSYDTLKVTFNDPSQQPIADPREYSNTYIARVGAEYQYNERLALRAGFLFDKCPVSNERVEASLPDADRLGYTIGLGYKLNDKLSVDLSYFYLHFLERTVTTSKVPYSPTGSAFLNGTYDFLANLASISFSYKF